MSSGSRQQVGLTTGDRRKLRILRSRVSDLSFKVGLLLIETIQSRMQPAPFFLLQFINQLIELTAIIIVQRARRFLSSQFVESSLFDIVPHSLTRSYITSSDESRFNQTLRASDGQMYL